MDQDQVFLEYIIKAIVNNPNDVKVTRTVDERGVLLTLDINPSDMGYVIGRQGQTARSVRTLLKIVGAKNNARVNLKINEPEGSTRVRRPMATPYAGSAPYSAPVAVTNNDDVDTSSVDLNI